jgi:sugar lactone lactonase YvrE
MNWMRDVVLSLLVLLAGLAAATAEDGLPKGVKFVLAWGKKGDQPGEFHSPIGIAITRKDELFVTDLNNSRVQRFSADGKSLGVFDVPRDDPKRRSCILGGIAVDHAGHIYLSFMNQHKLAVYTEAGKLVREWGKKGTGPGEFHQPGSIVLNGDGTLFVTDQCNHRIQKLTIDGKFLAALGEYGAKPGQFDGILPPGSRFGGPHFLAKDSKGRLYTTEGAHTRVQQLTSDGKPLAAWGTKTHEPGGFGGITFGNLKATLGPIGVAVDKHDRVWVSSLNDRVQCFTPEGKFLFGLGLDGPGDEPGQFARPHAMAFDSAGHLYVADAGNQRIQRFVVPGP